jgi:putative transport protein
VHLPEVSDPRSARAVRFRSVIDVLADDSILLVFLVIALGAGIGAVRIKGVSLGPAAALFAGLAVGAVDESLSEADGLELLRELGLVLFTYTIGLASGPTFFAGLRRGGAQAIVATYLSLPALPGCAGSLPAPSTSPPLIGRVCSRASPRTHQRCKPHQKPPLTATRWWRTR